MLNGGTVPDRAMSQPPLDAGANLQGAHRFHSADAQDHNRPYMSEQLEDSLQELVTRVNHMLKPASEKWTPRSGSREVEESPARRAQMLSAREHYEPGKAEQATVVTKQDQLLAEVRANRPQMMAEIERRDKMQELSRPNGELAQTCLVPSTQPRPTLPVASKALPNMSPARPGLGIADEKGNLWASKHLANMSPSAVATVPVASPIDVLSQSVPVASRMQGSGLPVVSVGTRWTAEDERQQQEAIRTIELLRKRAQESQSRTKEPEAEGWSWKEAAKQQVKCLEYELDDKEAALQVAEHQLEQRETALLEVQQQLESLQAGDAQAEDAARIRSLRIELDEKERQLELKEQNIQQLMAILHQHGSSLMGEQDRLVDRFSPGFSVYPTISYR